MLILGLCGTCTNKADKEREQKIEVALTQQLQKYPQSNLQDIYKNFYQDRFGSEHIVNEADTQSMRLYIESEITTFVPNTLPLAEALGWEHNFVRINTRSVSQNLITSAQLAVAFIESATYTDSLKTAQWVQEWQQIVSIIEKKQLPIKNFEKDKTLIDSLLQINPKVAMHHSADYRQAYAPHYRIVAMPILKQKFPKIAQQIEY
jgi:hypothetical protein